MAHLAGDPAVERWTGQSLSSGQLAQVNSFTDLDGSHPDCWRFIREVRDAWKPAMRPDTGNIASPTTAYGRRLTASVALPLSAAPIAGAR